jgi:bifunctional non-homologous end joining protein LigD
MPARTNNLPHIEPMKLSRVARPFDDPAWIYELKHDGFRGIASIEDGRCQLVSRRNHVYKKFGSLCDAIARDLRVRNAILDGEIVCLDCDGRSLFNELLYRRGKPVFYMFDLLWLNGRDLRQVPLLERKQILRGLIRRNKDSRTIYAQHVEAQGCKLFAEICRMDLEGIVAKRRDGLYLPQTRWIKIKNPDYTQAEGRHELFEGRRSGQGSTREARRLP